MVDLTLTSGATLTWRGMPIVPFTGSVTPFPCNDRRLKALGKSYH